MNNLYLIGYRGVGKSTLAPLLAQKMGWSVVEMDDLIEQREQATIAEIFTRQGEVGFRLLETAMLREVSAQDRQVISTGGGIVKSEDNRLLMRANGTVVWLQTSAETILQRLEQDAVSHGTKRPSLTGLSMQEEIAKLLVERNGLYAATSHFTVDTETHKLNEVVDTILTHLHWV